MDQNNDRKRSFEGEESSTKRFEVSSKPLDNLSETGPITQRDVVYFQKEAIWRQLNSYKHQLLITTKDLKRYKKNYEANENKLSIVDRWYEQILNLFGSMNDEEVDELVDDDLLISLNKQTVGSIDNQLQKRRSQLIKLLKPIIENSKISNIDSQELIKKYEVLNNQLIKIKSDHQTIEQLKIDLEDRIESLQQELITIHKEKDRNDSKTLKRVDESLVNNDNNEQTLSNGHNKDSTNGHTHNNSIKHDTNEGSVKKEMNGGDSNAIKKEGEADQNEIKLENETNIALVEEYKIINEKLNKQIEEVNEKYNKELTELITYKDKLENLGEEEVKKTIYYKNLLEHNDKIKQEFNEVNKIKDQLMQKLNKFESENQEIEKLINEEILKENESLKLQLNKSEIDLVRIRTTRDELLSKQTILKLEIENKQTNEELLKLSKLLSNQLDDKNKSNDEIEENDDKYNEMEKEEVIKRIKILENEIKEIEIAFQEAKDISIKKLESTIDSDNLIKKLTIEKTKADQKYFASMRLKDSLSNENKVLKIQISKSQELINKLNELEKTYLNKNEILSKTIQDYKIIKESSIEENSKLQETNKLNENLKKNLEEEVKNLKNLIIKIRGENNKLNSDIQKQEILINKQEIKLKQNDNLINKYKNNNLSNSSMIIQEDENQLEALRSIAKCSVCLKNWKDTVITACGHVFCNECTQERLAARLRRCPSCNKGFSANDLLSIHL